MSNIRRASFFLSDPWGPAYVWARALVALSILLTLIFNSESTILHARTDVRFPPACASSVDALSAFCHGPASAVRWVGVAVLLAVLSGYRPRWFALPHAWVAWSVAHTMSLTEGGDQIAANVAIFMVPLALLDDRVWVWRGAVRHGADLRPYTVQRTLGLTALALMRLQGLVLYLDASISKFSVPEWTDGTATYYWMRDPIFSPGGFRQEVAVWLTGTRLGAALTTWGTLAIELALAAAFIGALRYRRALMVTGLLFHFVIAISFGLVTFGVAVAGLLFVYLAYDLQGESLPSWIRYRTQIARPVMSYESAPKSSARAALVGTDRDSEGSGGAAAC